MYCSLDFYNHLYDIICNNLLQTIYKFIFPHEITSTAHLHKTFHNLNLVTFSHTNIKSLHL